MEIAILLGLLFCLAGLIDWGRKAGKTSKRSRRQKLPTANLRGDGLFECDVVGESHYQQALEKLCGGRTEDSQERIFEALLVPDDDNPHDSQAVRVEIGGHTVGHLSRQMARGFRQKMADAGFAGHVARTQALVRGGWYRGPDDCGHFGVRVDLPMGDEE